MKSDVCLFCGAPASLLCDGHLGYPPATPDQEHHAFNGLDLFRPFTCDAPMCRSCAELSARYTLCRRNKGCHFDTVDYCPGCQTEKLLQDTPPSRRRIDSEAQAKIIRAAHWRTFSKSSALSAESGGGQISLF